MTTTKFTPKQSYRYAFAEVLFCNLLANGDKTFAIGDVNVGKREWVYKSMIKSEIIESYAYNDDKTVVCITGFKNPNWYKDNFGYDVKNFVISMARKEFNLDNNQITRLRHTKMKDFNNVLIEEITAK